MQSSASRTFSRILPHEIKNCQSARVIMMQVFRSAKVYGQFERGVYDLLKAA